MTQFGFPLGGDLLDGDRYVTWDAAYVLGSLTSSERREYEAHLESCKRCRAAVGEISGIPALLAMLDLEDVRALDEETPATTQALEMAKVSETPINASISLTGYGWGTRIDMACSYGDWGQSGNTAPQTLGMVVVGRDGSHTQVATWLGLSGATALPSATTPLQKDEIAAVQLVSSDNGKVLLERHL